MPCVINGGRDGPGVGETAGEGVAVGVALADADADAEGDNPRAATAPPRLEFCGPPLSASTATHTPIPTMTATTAHGMNQDTTDR
jgi:hypothetical protein